MTIEITTSSVDWDQIADRLGAVMAQMLHHDGQQLYGNAFYAEALRRTFSYEPAGEDQRSRDRLGRGFGLQTEAYAKHLYDSSALDRMQREKAEEQVKGMRAEVRRVYAEARKDVAEYLREKCNERTVPSRYRREGVMTTTEQTATPAEQAAITRRWNAAHDYEQARQIARENKRMGRAGVRDMQVVHAAEAEFDQATAALEAVVSR